MIVMISILLSFMVALIVTVVHGEPPADVIYWCNDSGTYYGYTERYGTFATTDNVMHFKVNESCMATSGIRPGDSTGPANLFFCADFFYDEVDPPQGGLPRFSSIWGGDFFDDGVFDDHSFVITASNPAYDDIIGTGSGYNAAQIMNGPSGAAANAYPNGHYLAVATMTYQADQMAPVPGSSNIAYYSFMLPPPPDWSTLGTTIFSGHVGQPANYPYQAAMGPRMKMSNSAIGQIYINGSQHITIPLGTTIHVTLDVQSPACIGKPFEAWVVHQSPSGGLLWWWFNGTTHVWTPSATPLVAHTGPLENFTGFEIDVRTPTLVGHHTYFLCIDMHVNGIVDAPLVCSRADMAVQ